MTGIHTKSGLPEQASLSMEPEFEEMPSLVPIECFSKAKRTVSSVSEATASTVSTAISSINQIGPMDGPKKPVRVKSGTLASFFVTKTADAKSVASRSLDGARRGEQSAMQVLTYSHPEVEGGNSTNDKKWCTLNDSKAGSVKRQIRRINRSFSDSEMSEASTIDSSSGQNAKSRRREIQERNADRKNRHDKRKAGKKKSQKVEMAPPELGDDTGPEEDVELVDTDQDMPISEARERAIRKLRDEERRLKSPRKSRSFNLRRDDCSDSSSNQKRPKSSSVAPRTTQSRSRSGRPRGGKKVDFLCSENPEYYRMAASTSDIKTGLTQRASSFNASRKKRGDLGSNSISELLPAIDVHKVNTFDDARRARANEKMHQSMPSGMIINSQIPDDSISKRSEITMDSTLLESPARFSEKPDAVVHESSGPRSRSARRQNSGRGKTRSTKKKFKESTNSDMKPQHISPRSSGKTKGSSRPSSRRELMIRSNMIQSDRFLCASRETDFAPRLSIRQLNMSCHGEINSPKQAPRVASTRDMMLHSQKCQSDRLLCVAKVADVAPRLSSRRLNASEEHGAPRKKLTKLRNTASDGCRSNAQDCRKPARNNLQSARTEEQFES